ncbi:LOW QUALITY PROTEIN: piRNA biogenesis protein EXD1 [Indicator indicator]|uniref:LOW QUALITY PROTEIN: piRNA biogenesis protein EXD1 n=1 Tax=Indicator indicator TaxID=1002788 RepID=UPI0023DEB8D5|nr:LOW QUALITY PROTEIN: piRNA biogenesis protein EXD1 [Indicator indicator]
MWPALGAQHQALRCSVRRQRTPGAILGRAVKVTLKCGVFEGVLQHVSPDRTLFLRTVTNFETSRNIAGVKMFSGTEIVNDEGFLTRMLFLKQQCVVSVAGEDVNLCQHGKLSWPMVTTKSHVFLFDIFLLGPQAFRNGFEMVLEDKHISKVMHDCLLQQYSVCLSNVFDTLAGNKSFNNRTFSLVQGIISEKNKYPLVSVSILDCMKEEKPDIRFLIPLPASLLNAVALKATYLLLLHSSLMDSFMSDLTAVVHNYLRACRTQSGDLLGSIKPTCMELPKEPKHLADGQKLRREKAIKDYRVNEDGLLIRAATELKGRNDAWESRDCRDDRGCFPTSKVVTQMLHILQQCRCSSSTTICASTRQCLGRTHAATSAWFEEEASLTLSGPWMIARSARGALEGLGGSWRAAPTRLPQRPTALPPAQGRKGVTSGTPPPPARASRETTPPHARLASSPGRFGRVPSAISVTTRPYQSAWRVHRWELAPRGLCVGTAPTVWVLRL